METVRELIANGGLVGDVRRLLQQGADDHAGWIRQNVAYALKVRGQDAVSVSALTGVAPGTVRGFIAGRPSTIRNVLLMAEALGYTLAQLDRPPEQFTAFADQEAGDEREGDIGASLLTFESAATPMAIILTDGTIVKTNRQLGLLLGYDEGELIGQPAATYAARSQDERAARLAELQSAGGVHGEVTQLRRKDGSLIDAVTSAVIVRDDRGEPRYIIARAVPLV